MRYYAIKTVEQFYMDANVPISAKTNIYEGNKRVFENYQDAFETEHDEKTVKAYCYNAKTNLLKIYC